MKKFLLPLFVLAAILALPVSAQSIYKEDDKGSVSIDQSGNDTFTFASFTCTSNATGEVKSVIGNLFGRIEMLAFEPVDSASPDNNFDVTFKSSDGRDALKGDLSSALGANLSNTATTYGIPLVYEVVGGSTVTTKMGIGGNMTLEASNMGDSKQFVFNLQVSR